MKEVTIKIINAFSIQGTGGNPAGVVLNADNLSPAEKQRVAAATGLSETAFVSRSNQADFKLDFFTPVRQIAHCGHATIATFSHLKKTGLIGGDRSSKETIDGNRDIFLKNGLTYMEQTAPSYIPVENALPEILGSLNLSETDLLEHHLPVIVNTGNSFLIVPVANTKILQAIKPDLDRIARYSEKMGLIGYYVFSPSDEASIAATARMFGPYYGIVEEAATGMAAGPLASYLYDYHLTQNTQLTIKQGEFMPTPSPSLIHVELVTENGKINRLYAGGDAFVSTEKSVTI